MFIHPYIVNNDNNMIKLGLQIIRLKVIYQVKY